jgi:hypothetical protein
MMKKVLFIVLALGIRGLMTQPLFAQHVSAVFQETHTETLTLAPNATIRLEDSFGDINIEGWNQPQVEITVIKRLPYDTEKPKSDKDLKMVKVASDRKSDNELVISTTVATHDSLFSSVARTKTDVLLEFQIHAPRDSKLVIHHGDGSVIVNNILGDIDAKSSRGDIVVIVPDPESRLVDARTKFGPIAADYSGDTHRKHLIGQSLVSGKTSDSPFIHLRMGYGGITLKTLPKEAYTADQ